MTDFLVVSESGEKFVITAKEWTKEKEGFIIRFWKGTDREPELVALFKEPQGIIPDPDSEQCEKQWWP